ncbi:MAG: NusG domain II-containing protein, partial [Candidatus Ventricola sp.]
EVPEATEATAAEPTVLPTEEPTADPTEAPAQEAAMVGPMPPKQTETVRGYVVLTVGGRQYGEPIPMDRDKIITIKQDDGKLNKVHITPETVYMEFSTCENQDCVGQGEVHVDTYKNRILGTYIICLPNNVSIEMIPAED